MAKKRSGNNLKGISPVIIVLVPIVAVTLIKAASVLWWMNTTPGHFQRSNLCCTYLDVLYIEDRVNSCTYQLPCSRVPKKRWFDPILIAASYLDFYR